MQVSAQREIGVCSNGCHNILIICHRYPNLSKYEYTITLLCYYISTDIYSEKSRRYDLNGKRFWQIVMPVKKQLSTIEKQVESLGEQLNVNRAMLLLTWGMLALTLVLATFAYFDVPEYPILGYSVTPINSQIYIDDGNQLVRDTEYIIKFSKIQEFFQMDSLYHDIKLQMPTKVDGYNQILDPMGNDVPNSVDSLNRTVIVQNIAEVNPFLLDINYVIEYAMPYIPVNFQPLPPNSNDSFYLFIRSTNQYDIKYARVSYNLTQKANLWLDTTIYDSWTNQSIIIYENNVPIQFENELGDTIYIHVRDLEKGGYKTYLIKKQQ